MAKQSFSVGQVLTAAQMTSLQQTAMLGGSATAKTTSYTLVAADAGTVVSVNSTSATTITVNTGLFAAGDTVTIQNWGSGAVTITAGTATVNTAGSLIVPQYDGGVLYFTSASAAIYFDWVQAGAVSPLTTKGDVWGYSTSDARIPVGANDTVLTADSTQALGVKWATVTGGGMTSLASGSLSGMSVVLSSISSSYENLRLIVRQARFASNAAVNFKVNGTTNNARWMRYSGPPSTTSTGAADTASTDINGNYNALVNDSPNNHICIFDINDYTSSTYKIYKLRAWYKITDGSSSEQLQFLDGAIKTNTSVDTIEIFSSANFSGGTYELFGVK